MMIVEVHMRSPPRVIPEDPHAHLDLALPIGRGGTGTVWEAHSTRPNGISRDVAAKVSHGSGTVEGQRRIRDLSWKLALVRHRAMVPIDRHLPLRDGRWALVTELVNGADLAHLRALGPVPVGPALAIIGEVADVLDVALRWPDATGQPLGLIHRDLKPSNIMLSLAGEVRLLDFGLAHAQVPWRESARSESRVWGTIGYMAPERLTGDEGAAGDVYALGVILIELCTGAPFGTTSTRREEHQARVDAALASFANAGAHPVLCELVASMITFDPGRRPLITDVAEAFGRLRAEQGGVALTDWAPGAVAEARHRAPPMRLPTHSRPRRRVKVVPPPNPVVRRDLLPPVRRIVALLAIGFLAVFATDQLLKQLTDDNRADNVASAAPSYVDVRPNGR